jgi:hypothetical protein
MSQQELAMRRISLATASCLFGLAAQAQTALVTDFPADASVPDAAAIQQALTGRSFNVLPSQGAAFRLEFQRGGYVYLNTDRGFQDSGTWRSEDGQWCFEFQRSGKGCNPTRLKDQQLYIKRASNGEVVALLPR